MQATTRSKQFVIDHRTVALAVVIAIIAVAGGTALLLTTSPATDGSDVQAVATWAQRSAPHVHRPTDRPASMTGSTHLIVVPASDLDRADRMDWFVDATLAPVDALETRTLDRATWTAYPGHAEFTN